MTVETFIPAGSSHVEQLQFDEEAGKLTVEYKDSGDRYYAMGWDRGMFRAACLAPSVGSYLHRHFVGMPEI